jgi:hypothetical protein
MKRTVKFVANGVRCSLDLESPREYQRGLAPPELSICGMADGHAGQCDDAIAEAIDDDAPPVSRVLAIWREFHLKPVPDAIVAELGELADAIDGKRFGAAPDVDDAPDVDAANDTIDSRDVVKAAEIYREAVAALGIDPDAVDSDLNADGCDDLTDDETALVEQFCKLKAFDEAGRNYAADWEFGETCVRDSYFTEYAEELAKDIGAVGGDDDAAWPKRHIDWEAAAEELKSDYTSIEFDGVYFWVR